MIRYGRHYPRIRTRTRISNLTGLAILLAAFAASGWLVKTML